MKVINHDSVKSQVALAEKLTEKIADTNGKRVRQGHVWSWLYRSGKTPPEYCVAIEEIVNGDVKCHELRPDVFQAPNEAAA